MANAYVQVDETRGYNAGERAGIASNSLVMDIGDLIYKSGGFISKVSTGNKPIGVSQTKKTFDSDNQTVALAKVIYTPLTEDTRLLMTITGGTITQVDEGKYFTCDSSQRIDGTTESTVTGDFIMDEFVSSTSGYFRVVPNVNAVAIQTQTFASSGNTTIGDASADTLTVNATSTFSAPVTVGVDDTGYDVKFFGATSGKSWLRDESADKMIVTGDASVSGTLTIPAGGKIVSSVSNTFYPVNLDQTQQALSGAGVVTLTQYYTAITNTGSDALTLADGTVIGQLKKVKMIVDPGTDSTLTFNTNATIVFADVGDYAVLIWNGSDWIPIELGNDADGATAPVYTPAA